MNAEIQRRLCDLARAAGTELKFIEGLPIHIYGCQHTEAPIAVINSDLPQCEQIFTILHEIGHFVLHCKTSRSLPMPLFVNRPYKNEIMAEIAYKTRRTIRRKFDKEWQADLWAFCAFFEIGCRNDFQEFLRRHPDKTKFLLLVFPVILKIRLTKLFKKLLRAVIPKTATS